MFTIKHEVNLKINVQKLGQDKLGQQGQDKGCSIRELCKDEYDQGL